MSEKKNFNEQNRSEIKMSTKKRRIDRLFLLIVLASAISFIIVPSYAVFIVSGVLIGSIGTSLIFELGIRRVESDQYGQVGLHLAKNIVIYAAMMFISYQIADEAFLACVVTIITYRLVLLNALRK